MDMATAEARPTTGPLLTTDEAAELLRVSPRTVQRLLASRTLKRVKIGGATRIRRRDLDEFVERGGRRRV